MKLIFFKKISTFHATRNQIQTVFEEDATSKKCHHEKRQKIKS